jgi:hypothetical protein
MLKPWAIDGKSGDYQYPKGEVYYQTRGVVVEPLYVEKGGGHWYIEENGKLLEVGQPNPFNGYCYRQDGQ